MPIYNDKYKFKISTDAAFSKIHKIGENPDLPGIFECQSCTKEIVMNRVADPLPPCSACKKPTATWKLVAAPSK